MEPRMARPDGGASYGGPLLVRPPVVGPRMVSPDTMGPRMVRPLGMGASYAEARMMRPHNMTQAAEGPQNIRAQGPEDP